MIEELRILLAPYSLLCLCSGILLIGSVLYLYSFWRTRRVLYLSIFFLGICAFIFISLEILVISFGVLDFPDIGKQMHRLQALSAAFFLVSLPYFLYHLLILNPFLKKFLRIYYRSMFFFIVFFVLMAYLKPSLFLDLEALREGSITLWNKGRALPGVFYLLRDILIAVTALLGNILIVVDLVWNKQFRYLIHTLAGSLIAITSGVFDMLLARQESAEGLFTLRIFSVFSLGVTAFIILSMIGVMKWLLDQNRQLENMMKLKSLGVLAGGIAHDFNNILTAVIGNLSLLQLDLKKDSSSFKLSEEIYKAACRAKNLTDQLLTFAKGGGPITETASIKEMIVETVDFYLHGSNIELIYEIEDELYPVSVDRGQMNQVLQNLVINAKQAMPEGGQLVVRARNLSQSPLLQHSPQGAVQLEIEDTGCGIDSRHLNSIFEPYFTTREKGSGLGLAICYSIVKRHQGDIRVKSEKGKGTVFTMTLPALDEKGSLSDQSGKAQNDKNPIARKVLILDDEYAIRLTLSSMLDELGCQCTETSRGEETLSAFKQAIADNSPYQFVITDMTIRGGMGGQETARQIRALDPRVVIIASSGYSEESMSYAEMGFNALLKKPYTIDDLAKILEEFL